VVLRQTDVRCNFFMKNIQALVYYHDSEKHIPTRGLPCSVLDIYRTGQLIKDSSNPINSGILFHENYNDVSIFENEIKSLDEILKFETVLRFLLFKEHISVLEPSVRFTIKNKEFGSFDSYYRIPTYAKDSADQIFQKSNAYNNLLPIEKITIADETVIESTNPDSIYINLKASAIQNKLLEDNLSKDFLHTIPQSLSIPFIHNHENNSRTYNAIFNQFLASLDDNYVKATEFTVKLGYQIQLPFFTNSVLSIAKNRDHIPDAIIELRNQLTPLRTKLYAYENEFTGISTTRELTLLQNDIREAILAYTQKIYEPGNVFSDSIRLIISLATNPNEYLGKIVNPKYSIANDFPVLFGNSNYKMMKGLINKDNLSTNISNFLTPEEIKKIST